MSNRDRLTVALGGPWRLYQRVAPPGWQMLGTVQRGEAYEIGALGRSSTGQYAQLNAGAVRSLDHRKAQAAINAAAPTA